MERRSVQPTFERGMLAALLAAIDAAAPGGAGILDAATIGLYTNAFDPHPDMVIGDFTAATFGGYAADASLALAGPFNMGEDGLAMTQSYYFAATDPIGTPETVMGYYIGTAAFADIICAERFADPVPFAVALDFLSLELILQLPFNWTVSPIT